MAKADYYVPDDRPWFKYYPEGMPHHLDYPEIPLYQFLDDSAKKYPEKTALVFYDKEITYQELKELSDRFAHALQNFGIQKGDRAFFLLPNCPQFVIAFYGTMKAGAIPVPFNPLYSAEELKYFFKDAEPRIVITLDTFYEKVQEAAKVTPQIEKIIVTNIADYFPSSKRILGKLFGKIPSPKCEGALRFQEFINISPNYNEVKINPKEDVATILYTSGTTGISKGVMLSHFNIIVSNYGLKTWFSTVETSPFSMIVPFFHVYGLIAVLCRGILLSEKGIIFPKFQTKECLQAIHKYKIRLIAGVPAIYSAFLQHFNKHPKQYNFVTLCGSGGITFPSFIRKAIVRMFPNAFFAEGYGLTETTNQITFDSLFKRYTKKEGAVGVPLFDVDIKIIDPNTERELPPGQLGEIVVKTPQIFKGYWRKPEETKKVLKDAWFYTKDVGQIDEDGILYITGRLDDMINVRGEKVWPEEIEKVLEQNLKVQEVAVIGVKDDYYGQTIKACVVLKEGYQASEQELIDFCKEKLAPHKIPHIIEFFKELPKSNLGKTLHYKLKEKENNK